MTKLNRWYYLDGVYTRDTGTIPEEGTDVWCVAWPRGQRIKPYGDGYHVVVGINVFHCDEFMGILERNERDGYEWGIDGVTLQREQMINGRWVPVVTS